jgi:quercetin dioxygenase-like cupin family protein
MELNADLSNLAVVHAADMPWLPSPSAGVERRMLSRVGGEQAIATSLVRYAARSSFPPHGHARGEEFLVLDGVFEDEHGRYPTGSYVRNPPGSAHAPRSSECCIIFVRLRQFREDDDQQVEDLPPLSSGGELAMAARQLFVGPDEHVVIERSEPHAGVDFETHGGLDLLMLAGELHACGESLKPWSWLRLPAVIPLIGTTAATGCTAWIKTVAPWPVRR